MTPAQTSLIPPGVLLILALLVMVGLAIWLSGMTEEEPETSEQTIEDRLYRALMLAASNPVPYRLGDRQFWHYHQGGARLAETSAGAECVGCVIEEALADYEARQRLIREAYAADRFAQLEAL